MRNFDEEDRKTRWDRDRSFMIGGREFVYRASVAPEVLIQWQEAIGDQEGRSETETLKVMDETVFRLLEPGCHDAWREVRNPDVAHPVTLQDIQDVMQWLIEEVVGRPTGPSSDSSLSPEPTPTGSTEDTSSPAEPEYATSTPANS